MVVSPVARWTAVLSPLQEWRYELRRIWDEALPLLAVCMLNPSLADAKVNDQTIGALSHFATQWGYGGILVVNLYAFRASRPKLMFVEPEDVQIGPDNWRYIQEAIEYAKSNGGKLLVAWGRDGAVGGRDSWFLNRAASQGVTLICLGHTRNGHPKHPMARGKHRIPRDQQPLTFLEAW